MDNLRLSFSFSWPEIKYDMARGIKPHRYLPGNAHGPNARDMLEVHCSLFYTFLYVYIFHAD